MIYLLLAEGFEEIEALAVVDILRRAELNVQTVSITDNYEVAGGHGIVVKADLLLPQMKAGEMLVLPGGGDGVKHLKLSAAVLELVEQYDRENKWIAAICAAPSILGEMGLLSGKRALCYPGFEGALKGAAIADGNVVIDGKIITSKGPGTVFDFAFQLVEILCGQSVRESIQKGMICS